MIRYEPTRHIEASGTPRASSGAAAGARSSDPPHFGVVAASTARATRAVRPAHLTERDRPVVAAPETTISELTSAPANVRSAGRSTSSQSPASSRCRPSGAP